MRPRDMGRRAIILALCLLIAFLTGGMTSCTVPAQDNTGASTPPGSYTYTAPPAVALRDVQVTPDELRNALIEYHDRFDAGTLKNYIKGLPMRWDPNAPRDQWLDGLKTAALARYARYQVNHFQRRARYDDKQAQYRAGTLNKPPPRVPDLKDWKEWLDDELIGNNAINRRGASYDEWVHTTGRPAPRPRGDIKIPGSPDPNRNFDGAETKPEIDTTYIDENKATLDIRPGQVAGDIKTQKWLDDPQTQAHLIEVYGTSKVQIRHTFGQYPSEDDVEHLRYVERMRAAGILVEYLPAEAQALGGDGKPVEVSTTTARDRKEAEKRAEAQRAGSGPGQKPAQGSAVDVPAASPDTAEDAAGVEPDDPALDAELAAEDCPVPGTPGRSARFDLADCSGQDSADSDEAAANAAADQAAADAAAVAQQYGGIDFSTLKLSYISDTDSEDGPGSQFAFGAKATADGQISYGGLPALQQASDSFFVWLALSPDKFTVNLSPDEPDRIVDHDFGRTDAGRILLTADLQLKKLTAQVEHPDTPLGAQYWSQLAGADKPNLCISERSWIVPGQAIVREDGDQLYILQAPLDVKSETDYVQDASAPADATGSGCERNDPEVDRHNQELFRSLILPKVVEAVNTAPEFQELRRVYFSRVAAQWIRDRNATKETAYSSIIDSDEIEKWKARANWDPKDVYQQYLNSYRNGEFNVTHTTETDDAIITTRYFSGGVDFTTVPMKDVGPAAFDRDWPGLAGRVQDSVQSVTKDGPEVLLGATAPPDPERNGVAAARADMNRMIQLVIITVSVVVAAPVLGIGGFLIWRLIRRRRAAG